MFRYEVIANRHRWLNGEKRTLLNEWRALKSSAGSTPRWKQVKELYYSAIEKFNNDMRVLELHALPEHSLSDTKVDEASKFLHESIVWKRI